MPDALYDQLIQLTNSIHTLKDTNIGKKQCEDFFAHKIDAIKELVPSAFYYIISKLEGNKQTEFIKENINYIKENHEDIFIYNMYSPKCLATFLNYNSLCAIYKLDKTIFSKMLNENFYEMKEKLTEPELTEFYNNFYNDINSLSNIKFITSLTSLRYSAPKTYLYIQDKYKDKISSFDGNDLLHYYEYQIYDDFQDFFSKFKDKFVKALAINNYFYNELDSRQQEAIFKNCYQELKEHNLFNCLLKKTNIESFVNTYKKYPEIIDYVDIQTIASMSGTTSYSDRFYTNALKEILNYYAPTSIDFLEKYNVKSFGITRENIIRKYIEKKYRDNIICDGTFLEVDMSTPLYSDNYLKNLKELSKMKIDLDNETYKLHLKIFIKHLLKNDIIDIPSEEEFKELNYLFYSIVKGKELTIIPTLSNIQDITLLNRLHSLEFNPDSFSIDQLKRYNIKHHKLLYSRCKNDYQLREYKLLTLKLMLMLGYKGSEYVLNIDDSLSTLQHLVGNVDVDNIKLDKNNNPILINRFINILFNDKDSPRIKEMLNDKTSLLYKYFPRIFNEWEIMKLSHKTDKLSSIFAFLESEDIHLPVKYYRLKSEIRHIGIKNSILHDAMSLHDKMLKRVYSSIPRVKGNVNDYEYEVLRFDDMFGMSVGNKTNCCFTIKGRADSCLKHALTSNNGRILVVRKDGILIAHSWLWRNGDVLCIDNIETNKHVNDFNFFDVYKDFIEKTIEISSENEGEERIKNITLGISEFTTKNKDILENFIQLNSNHNTLPSPEEKVFYSDAKSRQYVLYGNENFKLFTPRYKYEDERPNCVVYKKDMDVDTSLEVELENNLNYLRYLENESKDENDEFKLINIDNLDDLYINKDYYIYIKNNKIYSYCLDHDYRAKNEYTNLLNGIKKSLMQR